MMLWLVATHFKKKSSECVNFGTRSTHFEKNMGFFFSKCVEMVGIKAL